jgi:adenylyl-sulfate kinase
MSQKKGFVLWLTGLSGAGKSTIAESLSERLRAGGRRIEILDGDEVRTNLSKGLGFSKEDRDTNVKRIGFVAKLLARNGVGVITAAISPYREVRREVREAVENNGAEFLEVFVKCPLETLVERDIKGLYKQALAGEITNFTGVSDPYEEPLTPDMTLETDLETVAESSAKIADELQKRGLLTNRH